MILVCRASQETEAPPGPQGSAPRGPPERRASRESLADLEAQGPQVPQHANVIRANMLHAEVMWHLHLNVVLMLLKRSRALERFITMLRAKEM